jgi:tellurite resistance-related uncharacterized protein
MNTRLTPLHLKLLLHAYSHCEPWHHDGGCALEYEQHLVEPGLVQLTVNRDNVSYYECTDKGKAHIEQLMSLQFPTQAWINKDGDVLLGLPNVPALAQPDDHNKPSKT